MPNWARPGPVRIIWLHGCRRWSRDCRVACWCSIPAAKFRSAIRLRWNCLGEPLVGQILPSVLARAGVNAGMVEPTELRSGRFVNISRRDLSSGGEVVLLTDVTESHLMQVFLTRQQRLVTLGELAAGLAHQIRTPLAAALLYASQMTLPDRQPAGFDPMCREDRRQPQTARQAGERHAGICAWRFRPRNRECERNCWNR